MNELLALSAPLLVPAFNWAGSAISWLEIVALLLALAMVVCNLRVNPIGWPLAIASSGLYGLLFLHSKLYGEAALQLVFIVLGAWGWWQWLRGTAEGARLQVRTLAPRQRWATLALTLAAWPLLGATLARITDSDVPYLDALPTHIVAETGRIHTHFHQLVAATGRLASSDPNLQNIPVRSEAGRKIRKAFVPRSTGVPPVSENGRPACSSVQDNRRDACPPFQLLSCDYSQIELRVMAALSQDATMIEAFQNGADIHTITAAKVFVVEPENVTSDMRRTAKMVNFGIIYGISAFGLSQRLAIPRTEAANIIDAYFREYPAIRQFMDRTVNEAREAGYVETLSGRRRYFPDLNSGNQNLRGIAERAAINTPIQGTAADMIKLAMIRIAALLREKSYQTKMLLQVHDELVFDLAMDEQEELVPKILEAMKTALPLPHGVPIEVSSGTGPNWLAAH